MEATLTPTLTAGAAWRMALSLTLSEVRSYLSAAFLVIKIIAAVAYAATAFILTVSESDDSIWLNVIGLVMGYVGYTWMQRKSS